jgi:hypothetical protein
MAWEDIQGRCFPGYGRCIYCGSDGGAEGLRDEHVIPFALEGNTRIEKASCRDCERRISPVDTHLGRSVFGQHRIHAGVQTRRPKERPTILPANFTIGGESVSLDLPIKDHPYALALPVWGDAGFFKVRALAIRYQKHSSISIIGFHPTCVRPEVDPVGWTETGVT